jgi:hypothetical protein
MDLYYKTWTCKMWTCKTWTCKTWTCKALTCITKHGLVLQNMDLYYKTWTCKTWTCITWTCKTWTCKTYVCPKGTKLWTHTQLSPMLVNTMKSHTCNTKSSQKAFEPRAIKPNLAHTSWKCHTHNTEPLTHNSKCHTKKSRTFFVGVSAN